MIQMQCPTPETLRQWTSGDSDDATANELAEHLRTCAECQGVLAGMDDRNSDSLVQQLKAADPLLEFREELDCQQASILAMGAITGQAMEETHTAMPVFPKEMDDYRLLELIAAGGMGKVYRAHHQRLGRDVAIKIISGRRLADANASLRFEQEIRALGRLSHPNIVAALDARQADGSPILIMEYVDGLDLSQIVKRLGALPAASVAAIGRAVAAAIAYASSNGLVHRDIKPSNIMINGKGEVKVLDLGLARIQLDGHVAPEWTGTGLAVGTPDYMSPEQINDSQTLNSQSDLYSLGCTLYRLLTGQPPYSGSKYRSNFEKLAAHVSDDPICIQNAKGQYPAKLVSIIERLLSKSPDKRADSAQSVALEFEKLSEGADLAGLLAMARKLQSVDSTTPASGVEQPRLASSRAGSGRIGSILRWTAALGGIPIGILFGIWLTIKNPDGSENKVQLPSNANATIDDKGNVQIDMAKAQGNSSKDTQAGTPPITAESVGLSEDGNTNELRLTTPSFKNSEPSNKEINSSINASIASDQPSFRGHSRDAWIKVLQNERSGSLLILAGEAVIALSESPEQKLQTMKLLLTKSRDLGGYNIDEYSDESGKWMNMLRSKAYSLFPQPFVDAASEEARTGNAKSILAILSLCHGATKEQLYRNSLQFNPGKGISELFQTPDWRPLIAALADASDRVTVKVPGIWDDSNYLLDDTLVLTDRLGIPYASLDAKLQAESKKLWEAAQLKPFIYNNYAYYNYANTPWLPYWRTLQQDSNHRVFMIKALFANLDQVGGGAKELFSSLGHLSVGEQTEVCEFLSDRFGDLDSRTNMVSGRWTQVFDYLRTASTLDQKNIAIAQQMASDLMTAISSARPADTRGRSFREIEAEQRAIVPERNVAKFRQLLGLPPKSGPASSVGFGNDNQLALSASKDQPVVSDQEINGLITASGSNQPLYRGHTFDEWANAMLSERSLDVQKIIVNALVTLAESPDQKSRAMKLIIQKSRTLGGKYIGSDNDSEKWMDLLNSNTVKQLLPHPFVEEATLELPQSNEKSFQAILFIAQTIPYEKILEDEAQSASPKWQDFVSALSGAHTRLQSSNGYSIERPESIAFRILAIAAQFDFPNANLDATLQTASKAAWLKFEESASDSSATNFSTNYSWIPYWATLPQQENRKQLIVYWMSNRTVYPPAIPKVIFRHFGRFTSEEQLEICTLLAQKYRSTYNTRGVPDIDWEAAIECIRRCSNLEPTSIESLRKILQHRRPVRASGGMSAGTVYGITNEIAPTDIDASPERVAELLGITLPPLDKTAPQPIAPPKGSKSLRQVPTNEASGLSAEVKDADREIDELILASGSNQPLYRGHSFDEWAAAMQSERSLEMQLLAVDAIVALAESPEQKSRSMRLILEKSRVLGNDATTSKWIESVVDKMHLLLPDPFLEEAIRELPQANTNSISAILRIYRRWGYDGLFGQSLGNADNSSQSPKMLEIIAAISSADSRLSATDPKYKPKETLNSLLTLAAAWNISYSDLEKKLQDASKQAWEDFKKTRPPVIQYWLPWLVYWKSLPQSENEKPFVVEMLLRRGGGDFWVRPQIYEHFGKFTPLEQSEICNLFARQYYSDYSSNTFFSWELPLECLRRCSTLEPSNLDKLATIVEKRYPREGSSYSSNYAKGKTEETNPRIFAELLGATLPLEVKSDSMPSAPPKVSNTNEGQALKLDGDLNSQIRASQQSDVPLVNGVSRDAWLKVLQNELSGDLMSRAGEALITLAISDEEKLQTCELLLQKSRQLGGSAALPNGSDSENWMAMLEENIYQLFPNPFLRAAENELQKDNKNSALAIAYLCFHAAPDQLFLDEEDKDLAQWKLVLSKLSGIEKYYSTKSTDDEGLSDRERFQLSLTMLAARLDVPYSDLPPAIAAKMKALWERELKRPVGDGSGISWKGGLPLWLPYWKTLSQADNRKARIVETLFAASMEESRARPREILDRLDKFTPKEQMEICKVLVTLYSRCEFVSTDYQSLWNDVFECLRRCSTLSPKDIDSAEEMLENARYEYINQGNERRQTGFPAELKPKHFHALLGSPFGLNATEASATMPRPYGQPSSPEPTALTLPPEKWIKPSSGGMM